MLLDSGPETYQGGESGAFSRRVLLGGANFINPNQKDRKRCIFNIFPGAL